MDKQSATVASASFQVGLRGRSVLPAAVRRAAGVEDGRILIARADGLGRIVLETAEAIQARVWAGAPSSGKADFQAQSLRAEEVAIADANFTRQSVEPDQATSEQTGAALLAALGL
ncbi:MAG TPA: AbrB/MazE/SpoVT family DNA-binding domain-containing protein [Candidatus Dormibacteraeota bacterium]|nr:AbrB/MazE/SpoVT family DNA-binding domain-containing protein [Candidatus Dormibacteraeota bacterium]